MLHSDTELRCGIGNTRVVFKWSRLQIPSPRPYILIEVFRGFSRTLQANVWTVSKKLGYDRFLPNTFQLTIP
jgi:hypothetical protein